MRYSNKHFTLLVLFLILWGIQSMAQGISDYNIIWNTQSKNSSESMPCGGGDVGMNIWV